MSSHADLDNQSPQPPERPGRVELVASTLLGIDWGRRRIGLAIKPAGQDWALPRRVIEVESEASGLAAVRQAIAEDNPQGVVVGLPVHPDPAQSQEVRRFCRKARRGLRGARWYFVDERLTSEEAQALHQSAERKGAADDLAAVLILETFMKLSA